MIALKLKGNCIVTFPPKRVYFQDYTLRVLTKSNFLSFLDSPIHFWAQRNNQAVHIPLSMFEQHLFEQGKEAEILAKRYMYEVVAPKYEDAEILWQPKYKTKQLEAIADAVIYDRRNDVYDVYEIKSSTRVKPEHAYDLTFQAIVAAESINIRNVNLVHLNRDYVRQGEININELFVVVNLNDEVGLRTDEVQIQIQNALAIAELPNPTNLETCLVPRDCPCKSICHPNLRGGSIFEINGLRKKKKIELLAMNVDTIAEVPADFALPPGQLRQVQAAQSGDVLIEIEAIREELSALEYPLYFVDYEAFNPAIPYFDGYRPYQYIPFQYSLHIIEENGSKTEQIEYLDLDAGDPAERLANHLLEHIGESGSLIVWNKSFEMGRHREMAQMYAELRDQLLALNERVYDLMQLFRKGHYAHPDFKGKYSIKKVLPVLAPGLSYESLRIPNGAETMLIWNDIHLGKYPKERIEGTTVDMLEYCKLDTLAMVRIWEHLNEIIE